MTEQTLKTITGKLKIVIPTHLSEITLGQMIALQNSPELDDIQAISILSGVPADDLKQVRNAEELLPFGGHIMGLAHQIKYLYNSEAIPKKVTFYIDGKHKTVNVIKDLAVEPAGAFMAVRELIADEIVTHIKLQGEDDWQQTFSPSLNTCCLVLAHYFYCRVTGLPYDEFAIAAFSDDIIKQMRVTEALPIAKRFFMNFPPSSARKTGFWHRMQQLWKNAQEYRRLKSLSMSIQ